MDHNSEIKNNIDSILNSLDHVHRAVPKPFFYTRLAAQLNRNISTWERVAALISKPAFAVAVIALFLFINIIILFNSSSRATSVSQDESSLTIENDYGLSVSSLYDINPEQNDIAQK